jgi:hypothetical protein
VPKFQKPKLKQHYTFCGKRAACENLRYFRKTSTEIYFSLFTHSILTEPKKEEEIEWVF